VKLAAIAIAGLVAGTPGRGQATIEPTDREVIVCMEQDLRVAPPVMVPAQALASKIFGGIGVRIKWHGRLKDCPERSILIGLSLTTSETLEPGALADAQPSKGTIHVFYDRISRIYSKAQRPVVLGHVLAHEIAHDLQGFAKHSDHGVMKAQWDQSDLMHMTCKPLAFDDKDVELIYRGLAQRAGGALAAAGKDSEAASKVGMLSVSSKSAEK